MKYYLVLILFCVSYQSFSQSAKARNLMAEIAGQWQVDENGNVTYVDVLELPGLSKDQIYDRARNYFTYNYNDANEVIQTEDKEQGVVVGKGFYDNVHMSYIPESVFDCWHILRVDIKEERARVILTLTQYKELLNLGSAGGLQNRTYDISSQYPINFDGAFKTQMAKAFYASHQRALETLDAVAKALKSGNIDSLIDDEW